MIDKKLYRRSRPDVGQPSQLSGLLGLVIDGGVDVVLVYCEYNGNHMRSCRTDRCQSGDMGQSEKPSARFLIHDLTLSPRPMSAAVAFLAMSIVAAMALRGEALNDHNLDEVVSFFRVSNPFAQHTWGWDTGRFMDWRWGSNTLHEAQDPGWFSRHCRVFRDGADIVAVSVAEYGQDDVCIITRTEDQEAVRHVLDWLMEQHRQRGIGLSFEINDTAVWLAEMFASAGLREQRATGHEWEYDLNAAAVPPRVPTDFVVESLSAEPGADYPGIAACIKAAFNTTRDVEAALISLQSNPMFRPELSLVARSPEGRIAAYCRGTVDPVNGVCSIDPVCSHPDYHRLGLGKAVVQACFVAQRNLGGRFCYIGSAPEPAPGTYLYRSLGPSNRAVDSTWTMAAEEAG